MTLIKMSEIKLPDHYVRGKGVISKNINDLSDVVVKTNDNLFEENEKDRSLVKLIEKKVKWPFSSPILVAKLKEPKAEPEPETENGKKKKSKKKKEKAKKAFKQYELIDGMHRYHIWRKLKQHEIEAEVKIIDNPADRYMEQYRTNSSHGLRIDKDMRDNAVRVAHSIYKVSLGTLVKETGLARASIARICAMKQRKDGPRKKTEKSEGGSKKSEQTFSNVDSGSIDMSVSGFLERASILITAFPKLEPELTTYLDRVKTDHDSKNKLVAFTQRLADLSSFFSSHLE